MTQITINIPDAVAPRVISGFAKRYNYPLTLEDGSPNPETKAQFAKRKVLEYIRQAVREAEIDQARNEATATAGASVDRDIQLS